LRSLRPFFAIFAVKSFSKPLTAKYAQDSQRAQKNPRHRMIVIGVISDTHGLLRPEAVEAMRGSDYIIHAGDVGDPAILDELREIAPLTAVRGNIDREAWARKLPETDVLSVDGVEFYVLHNIDELDLKPEAAGFSAVIYGHSHVPKQEQKNGVLYLNPGSAGPRRFRLPVTVARLRIHEKQLRAEIVSLSSRNDAAEP
jgi:putative phosphoesterase